MSKPAFYALLGLSLRCIVAAPSVWAHHSTLPFDGVHPTTIHGVVTEYGWINPHTYVRLDVKDDAGNVEHWTVEAESPIFLRRLG